MTRIIILAPSWLGDAVMSLPALQDIRRHFGGAHLAVAARQAVVPLFRAVPGVDDVIVLGGRESAERFDADIGILFPNSFRSALTLKRGGVKERWGYRSDWRGLLLTRAVPRPRHKMHFGEYYQALVNRLGISNGPMTPKVTVSAARVEAATTLLANGGWTPDRPLVGIAPGAAFGFAKQWHGDRYGEVANALVSELGATCVLLGRDDDRDAGRRVQSALRPESAPHVINLIGRTDLPTLMGVLARCRVLIANDSGALHLAGAIGIAVTGIYGPTDERYSYALSCRENAGELVASLSHDVFCRPCFLRECPIDHRCMTRISSEVVFGTVRRQLELVGPLDAKSAAGGVN
jgi:lipopolysaccharide heptosyltransferase II